MNLKHALLSIAVLAAAVDVTSSKPREIEQRRFPEEESSPAGLQSYGDAHEEEQRFNHQRYRRQLSPENYKNMTTTFVKARNCVISMRKTPAGSEVTIENCKGSQNPGWAIVNGEVHPLTKEEARSMEEEARRWEVVARSMEEEARRMEEEARRMEEEGRRMEEEGRRMMEKEARRWEDFGKSWEGVGQRLGFDAGRWESKLRPNNSGRRNSSTNRPRRPNPTHRRRNSRRRHGSHHRRHGSHGRRRSHRRHRSHGERRTRTESKIMRS